MTQVWMTDGEVLDPRWETDWSSRGHLLRSQNHSVTVFQRYVVGSVCGRTGRRRLGTDRDVLGSDVEAGRDRSACETRLLRRTGRERLDGSDGVDMVQLGLEGVDAKRFVPARVPLLASMGRWVILSNDKSLKTLQKREITGENTDRDA